MLFLKSFRSGASRTLVAFSLALALVLIFKANGWAQDWGSVTVIDHGDYQAVNGSGNSTYSGTAPFRLRGVVLNNTEDWLNPTENYSEALWNLGGESEIFVQAVNLDGTAWDPDAATPFNDSGGTAAWIGQCYGNLGFIQEPACSYIDQAMEGARPVWYDELDRLGFNRPGTTLDVSELVRAGDLVEIRARVNGFNYQGKHNVNEQHSNNPDNDYEVVILQKEYGLPAATRITLGDVKDASDVDIFDSTRQTGGELYQATLVEILNVRLQDLAVWGANADPTLLDDTGRSLPLHLGLDGAFDTEPAPTGYFNIMGIMDQKDPDNVGGYRLLALDYSGIRTVPEPASVALLATGGIALLAFCFPRRRDRR